jgi:monoamine oxidase
MHIPPNGDHSMSFTRRSFIMRVGQAGGYKAAFIAMQGLGLMPLVAEIPPPVQASPRSGKGTRVVILGAGIAGLVSAYELRALGYDCTVLEALQRPGGRNLTVRQGDSFTFLDGTTQTCTWEKGNYQNFGPGRLPSIHTTILGYCRKLGVELQVEVNMSSYAHLQNDAANGGQPEVMRQVRNDARGHVSELLSKSIYQGALDQDLSPKDRERMLSFLRIYGPLDDANKYLGSDRAGYSKIAGAGDDIAVLSKPISLDTLLDENFWQGMLFDEAFDMQATMFQPVGGMDRIAYAFAKELGDIVRYGAVVSEIRKTTEGVRIGFVEKGVPKQFEADYCICTMPLTILKSIPNDFSAPHKKVIAESSYSSAYKIAWESRRFWEQDYNIYGGLEFVNTGCSPIWLPSAGMFSKKGVLVSGYSNETGTPFEKLSIPEKLSESRKSVERLHPGHGKELEKPMYLSWGKMPHLVGSWIHSYGANQDWSPINGLTMKYPGYETLIQPDGRIVFAGDHVSHQVGWQEGAAVSALRAVQQVSDSVKAARLTVRNNGTPVGV